MSAVIGRPLSAPQDDPPSVWDRSEDVIAVLESLDVPDWLAGLLELAMAQGELPHYLADELRRMVEQEVV